MRHPRRQLQRRARMLQGVIDVFSIFFHAYVGCPYFHTGLVLTVGFDSDMIAAVTEFFWFDCHLYIKRIVRIERLLL